MMLVIALLVASAPGQAVPPPLMAPPPPTDIAELRRDGVTPPPPAKYELIDRVIATVHKDTITLSDLERQARVVAILSGGPQGLALLGDSKFIKNVTDFLVNQLLIIQEMRKQPGYNQGVGEDDAR